MGTTYTSLIHLPGGVVLTASIEIPDEARYDDQGELGEVVQHAVNALAGAVAHHEHVTVDRPRPGFPDPWGDVVRRNPDPFLEEVDGGAHG